MDSLAKISCCRRPCSWLLLQPFSIGLVYRPRTLYFRCMYERTYAHDVQRAIGAHPHFQQAEVNVKSKHFLFVTLLFRRLTPLHPASVEHLPLPRSSPPPRDDALAVEQTNRSFPIKRVILPYHRHPPSKVRDKYCTFPPKRCVSEAWESIPMFIFCDKTGNGRLLRTVHGNLTRK